MEDVDLRYAKEHLEELVGRVARGEDVTIVVPAVGKVRMSAVREAPQDAGKPRRLGHLEGRMKVPARLMEPMSDQELRDWYGDDA